MLCMQTCTILYYMLYAILQTGMSGACRLSFHNHEGPSFLFDGLVGGRAGLANRFNRDSIAAAWQTGGWHQPD